MGLPGRGLRNFIKVSPVNWLYRAESIFRKYLMIFGYILLACKENYLKRHINGVVFFFVKDTTCIATFLAGSIQLSVFGKILRKSSIK